MLETTENFGSYTYNTQHFDSMAEIAEHIQETPEIGKYELAKNSYLKSESHFLGIDSFDSIIDRLKYGDNKMTTMYLDKIKALEDEGIDENNGFFMDIEGFGYDMGAVVAGEPECCINQGYPEIKPFLKIYIDTGYCGGVSPITICNRGVAIFQLISNLLSMGYILDVRIIHYITTDDGKYLAQTVKLSTDYLVTSQLAFGGTCEFFRIVTWLLTAIQKLDKYYTGGGKSEPKPEVIKEFKKDGLYIPSGYTDSRFNYCTQQQAIEYVTGIYNEYVRKHNGNH